MSRSINHLAGSGVVSNRVHTIDLPRRGEAPRFLSVFALVLAVLPAVSAGVFPGQDWQTASPDSQGVNAETLKGAMDYVQANAGGPGAAESVVVRHGHLIWKGSQADNQHSSWSCSKSFASTVLGLLIEDGRCTLDTKAATFLPKIADRCPA